MGHCLRRVDQLWATASEECSPSFQERLHDFIAGSLTQVQAGARAIEDLKHTEAAKKARKARRTGSRRSLQKGGVLLASEARNMAVKRQEDELAQAKAIVDKAEKAQIKAARKALLTAVATMRRDMVRVRTGQKKLEKEVCKEIRVKAKARAKRFGIPV